MVLRPSQWLNIGWIIFGIVGSPLILPPLLALYKIIELYTWTYNIDQDWIIESKGVFFRRHREISIYRIKSFRFDEPFLMRLVGLGNLYIRSSDPYKPEMVLLGIQKGTQLWQMLKTKNIKKRRDYGVKEYDLFNL